MTHPHCISLESRGVSSVVFEGYKRALEIADSPNVGMCFCVGCWLEGGELMGKDVIESIRYFGERNKIFKVHFRNVDQPLPHFVETFVDNGYQDMYHVAKSPPRSGFQRRVNPRSYSEHGR